jgi:SAM-dependent methyltransferase
LARDYGCEVVGLDISPVHIAIAERLTALTGFSDGVTFICASADAVPLRDGSFTVAWSQCSIPGDLAWLREMNRLVMPGGRLAFTGLIRRERTEEPAPLSLGETVARVEAMGYRIISAEDISQMDFECGWLPTRRKLEGKQAHYGGLFGDEWVAEAYRRLDADIAAWREGRMGKGRIVAVKG